MSDENNDKIKEKDGVVPFKKIAYLKRVNGLITAKYKASIDEIKINFLASLLVQEGNYEEKADGYYVTMKASYLKAKLNKEKSGSFYSMLKRVANSMTGNNIGCVDDEKEEFVFLTLINKAEYKDGIFSIRYPLEAKNLLFAGEDKYTILSDEIVMNFESNYAYRIYEILKEQAYYPKTYTGKRDYYFIINVGLAELKLDIGIVNTKLDAVRNVLIDKKSTRPDYERAVEKSPEKMYANWQNFKTRVLEPSIKEINELTEMYVEYKPCKSGKGGKVYSIDFHVWLNGAESKKEDEDKNESIPVSVSKEGKVEALLSDEERFTFILQVAELFKLYDIKYDGALTLCEAANYDMEQIKKAYRHLERNKSEIKDLIRWLVAALNWEEKEIIEVKAKASEKKKNQFNNFNQRHYDEEELEKILLNSSIE